MNKFPEHISSEQLVEQYQNGNRDALKLLIKIFHPKMTRTIHYYTQNLEPADDLAQECWYHIIRQLGQVDLKISFDAWAHTIAKRKAIDWIREQQHSRKMDRELLNQSAEADYGNNEGLRSISDDKQTKLAVIQTAIQKLPHSQKIVLSMFYLENLSVKEIGNVLEVSNGTVKSRLFHARENLKKIIST
ncbi:MAG: RNA polymerase sigma factor [Salibacteraceae bacterium]